MQKTRALTSEGDAMTSKDALDAINRAIIDANAKSDYYTGYKNGLELGKSIINALIESTNKEESGK